MTYDANGNTTKDNLLPANQYSYDVEGRPVSAGGVTITYDALGRAVEMNNNGSYTQFVYSPTGQKFAYMNSQSVQKYIVPLTGGVQAVYNASGFQYVRHADWLGSSRLQLDWNGNLIGDRAYAPIAETYVETGTADRSFTGQTQDVLAGSQGIYDFHFRQQASSQGRWLVPDPAGLAAVDITNPQTWNRYAYVGNNPLSRVDPLGLDYDYLYCGSGGCTDYTGVDVSAGLGGSPFGSWGGGGYQGGATRLNFVGDDKGSGSGSGQAQPKPQPKPKPPQQPTSYANCVKNSGNYFSLQNGLQSISGGQLGNGPISSALLGNPFSDLIGFGQTLASGSADGSGAIAADAIAYKSGDAAVAVASKVPNVSGTFAVAGSVAVSTPSMNGTFSYGVSVSGSLPFGSVAMSLAKGFAKAGSAANVYNAGVTAVSSMICAIGR